MNAGTDHLVDMAPGIRRLRAANPSPMTGTGTNTYLLQTAAGTVVIDPGPLLADHLAAVLAALQPGLPVAAILISHPHLDHSALARPLADATGAKVMAFGTATSGRSPLMQRLAAQGLTGGGEGVDTGFAPDIRLIENTTIMGEGAAAVLVGHAPGRYRLRGCLTRHAPQFWQNTGHRDEAYLDGFEAAYLPFACDTLRAALTHFGIAPAALRLVLPHNVNLTSWLQIAQETGLARDQLWLKGIGRVGHCFGADPFINLATAEAEGVLAAGDLLLLVSIGLGATASCALLEVTTSHT